MRAILAEQETSGFEIRETTKILNYAQFLKKLKNDITENFNLKFLGSQVKIQFHKLQNCIDFKRFVITKNYAFHTYLLPEEKH